MSRPNGVVGRRWPHHPLSVRCLFRHCILVNFAVDPDVMDRALPDHIEPDVHDGRAWLSVVVGNMASMRPVGVPRALGITYNQIVYRAVVRCQGERGVHFLRSDADNRLMCELGDRLTFFGFHHADIALREDDDAVTLTVLGPWGSPALIRDRYELGSALDAPPPGSRFGDAASAKDFLVELYTAYSYDPERDEIEVVRIDRGEWRCGFLPATDGLYDFMQRGPVFDDRTATMDSIISVGDVPYRWHRLERRPVVA